MAAMVASHLLLSLPWWTWVVLVAGGALPLLSNERKRRSRPGQKNYLQSSGWKERRQEALERAGRRCEDCGRASRRLEVRHLTYERWGHEAEFDLRVRCPRCHARRHDSDRGLLQILSRVFD
jgi:hypothetical protein